MSSVRNTLEETFKSAATGFCANFSHQLSEWLRENKQVDISPEELCAAFDIPYRQASTPSMSGTRTVLPSIPDYYSGTAVSPVKKKGGRSKKAVDPNAAKCEYKMTRGTNSGKTCDTPVSNDGSLGSDRFCKACLKKAAVKSLLETTSGKSTVQPPQIPGNSTTVNALPEEKKDEELSVIPIDGQDGWFRETNHGFIIRQEENGSITVHKIEDKNGTRRDLNENERKIAKAKGLQFINTEPISVPSLPALNSSSIPTIPTIPNIPMPR